MGLPVFVIFIIGAISSLAIGFELQDVLAKAGLKANTGICLFGAALLFTVLFLLLLDRLSDKLAKKDRRYWPFKNREEYESAMRDR